MKIRDLKEHIKDLPDDTDVIFVMDIGCCGETESLDLWDSYKGVHQNYICFNFNPLPGLDSCRKAGHKLRPRRNGDIPNG